MPGYRAVLLPGYRVVLLPGYAAVRLPGYHAKLKILYVLPLMLTYNTQVKNQAGLCSTKARTLKSATQQKLNSTTTGGYTIVIF